MTRSHIPSLKETLTLTPERHLALALQARGMKWGKDNKKRIRSSSFFALRKFNGRRNDNLLRRLGSDDQFDVLFAFTPTTRTKDNA